MKKFLKLALVVHIFIGIGMAMGSLSMWLMTLQGVGPLLGAYIMVVCFITMFVCTWHIRQRFDLWGWANK